MNAKELREFIEKFNLETKVVECLRNYLEEYKNKHFDEFNEIFTNYEFSKIETWLHSISYKIYNWPELDFINIVIELTVSYDESDVGVYQLFCNVDGSIEDDVLRIR